MAEPLSSAGRFLWATAQMITSADLNRTSTMLLRTLFDTVLGRLFTDPVEVTGPVGGFFGSDFKVQAYSGMTVRVHPGIGFLVKTPSTAYDPSFVPVCLEGTSNVAVSAAHATLPRWDIVYIDALADDVEPGSRNFYTTGSAIVDTIREFDVEISYLAGTAASTPTVPTTPAGKIKIAEIYVAAAVTTINAADIRDMRAPLRFDPDLLLSEPPSEYSTNFVPGSGNELLASVTGTGSIKVTVQDGEAVVTGYRHKYTPSVLTLSAGHATLGRIDLICADDEGEVIVLAGTPASPALSGLATPGAGQMIIAYVLVPATVVDGTGCTVTDRRVREPIGVAQIRDNAVTTAKIEDEAVTTAKLDTTLRPLCAAISFTGTTTPQAVTIQLQDPDTTPILEAHDFELLLMDQENNEDAGTVSTNFAPSAGTIKQTYQSYVNPTRLFGRTNSSGVFEFSLVNSQGAGTYAIVRVTTLPGVGDGLSQVAWKEILRTT